MFTTVQWLQIKNYSVLYGNYVEKVCILKIQHAVFYCIFQYVYYCANEDARSKNYNLRTAQKTITLCFSFAACTKFLEW